MQHEEQITRLFFAPAPASARKFDQAEAIIKAAPEEAKWRLTRLVAACRIVRCAMRGEPPPTRWEVVPVRGQRRAARVERAKARAVAAGSGPEAAAPAVEPAAAAPVVEPARAPVPAPTARPAMVCPRCGSTKLVRCFAGVWACEICGGQVKQALPGVAP